MTPRSTSTVSTPSHRRLSAARSKSARSGGGVASGRSAVEHVVRLLEEDIIFGRLKPRERLVEDALMERHGAKRHVVREALSQLERLGIVERQPNKGSAVRDFEPSEVEDLYEMRALLHRQAAERIPLPAPKALIDRLQVIHESHAKAVREGDLQAVYHLNNDFHDVLFGACGNRYLVRSISEYAWLAHAIRSYRIGDPKLLRQAPKEHALMIKALRVGDRKQLIKLCVDHIVPSKEAYLAQAPKTVDDA